MSGYSASNYKGLGGDDWHVAGTLDIESGGVLTVKDGASLVIEDGALGNTGVRDSGVITITNAQLLALNATPKTLVAAPGANKAIVPIMVVFFHDYATAAFTVAAGEDLAVKYTDGSGTQLLSVETVGFLDQASDQKRIAFMPTSLLTPTANAALVLHMLSGEAADGGGVLYARVLYRVVDTGFAA